MANKLNTVIQANVYASMMLQLHSQSAQHELMQHELQKIRHKLDQASRTLAQKDQVIDSLESDLEHMLDQLIRIQHTGGQSAGNQQWMHRALPGLNTEANGHSLA